MSRRIDIHTHSTASDGTDSPAGVVAAAAEAGVDVLGLTDHESADGWAPAARAASEHGMGFVPGIELSTKLDGASIHVLGYLVDPTHPGLVAEMRRVRDARLIRAHKIIDRLSVDYDITVDDVNAHISDGATVGRPHIADALAAKGIVPDRSAAFRTILHPGSPYYVSTFAPAPLEVVGLIRAAGGVPVLAHPGRARYSGKLTDQVIAELVDGGLAGLEVWHRENPAETREDLLRLAALHGLLVTGSSDYHGTGKPNRIGENTTPEESLERIISEGTGTPASL